MLERIPPREWRDLAIAWFAISVAFAIVFTSRGTSPLGFLLYFLLSLSTVGIGFILHEMAHKFSAIHFGFQAEFRKDTQMLLVAVMMAAITVTALGRGFVFAVPGATVITPGPATLYLSKEQNGIISAAGPAINLLLCVPFFLLMLFTRGFLQDIGYVGVSVNAMLAFFNMLPVPGLDGSKIIGWNPAIFAVLFVASLGILFAG